MPRRFKVEISPGATDDLTALHTYVAEHGSLASADALLSTMREAAERLETFPLRGPVPRELEAHGGRGYRQLSLPPYRIFYKVVDRTVTILLIADGRRDIPALLSRRLLSRPS